MADENQENDFSILSIHIQDVEDKNKPLLPERYRAVKKFYSGAVQDFCILEKRTKQGKTSVSFNAIFDDGSVVNLEVTGKMLEFMYQAYLGAEQKFQNKNAQKN